MNKVEKQETLKQIRLDNSLADVATSGSTSYPYPYERLIKMIFKKGTYNERKNKSVIIMIM